MFINEKPFEIDWHSWTDCSWLKTLQWNVICLCIYPFLCLSVAVHLHHYHSALYVCLSTSISLYLRHSTNYVLVPSVICMIISTELFPYKYFFTKWKFSIFVFNSTYSSSSTLSPFIIFLPSLEGEQPKARSSQFFTIFALCTEPKSLQIEFFLTFSYSNSWIWSYHERVYTF